MYRPEVAPLDGLVEPVRGGELLEPPALGRVPCDAVEQRGQDLRRLQAHVLVRLVDHELLHGQLIGGHPRDALGELVDPGVEPVGGDDRARGPAAACSPLMVSPVSNMRLAFSGPSR